MLKNFSKIIFLFEKNNLTLQRKTKKDI